MGANQSYCSGQPRKVATDDIGPDLENKYGDRDPDMSIDCFYIRLGQEIMRVLDENELQVDLIAEINTVLGENAWKAVEPGWTTQGLMIVDYAIDGKSEREQEQDFNEKNRKKLITKLENLISPSPAIHIMFSRACLYTDITREDGMTTDRIGSLLEEHRQESGPIDYFYLFVHADHKNGPFVHAEGQGDAESGNGNVQVSTRIQDMTLLILKTLPGEWRAVLPEKTWPGTFIGYFPKVFKMMTERERESKLNEDVRLPLIARLNHQLAQMVGKEARAHILITRACKYTP